MHGPPLVGWLLVALCGATAAYCLMRMRIRAAADDHGLGGEALMGIGMAVMAVPTGAHTSQRWVAVVFAVVFAGAALRGLLLRIRGGTHHLHHTVGCLAMVYMALTMAGGRPVPAHTEQTGHGVSGGWQAPGGVPLLTGLLLAYYAVYVLRAGVRLMPGAGAAAVDTAPVGSAGGVGAGAGSAGGVGAGAAEPRLAWSERPELATVCRVSMGLGMFAMLLAV